MEKKTLIIIPNENKYQIPLYVHNCEFTHLEGFMNFIYHNDINYQIDRKTTSQEIAFHLGESGYVVMLHDYDDIINENNLVVFLPNELSQKQFDWFQKRKEGLKNYNIMIFESIKNDWIPIDNTTTNEPIISELDKITNKKLVRKLN